MSAGYMSVPGAAKVRRVINWTRRAQARVRVRASGRAPRARLALQEPPRRASRSWAEMVARPVRVPDPLHRRG